MGNFLLSVFQSPKEWIRGAIVAVWIIWTYFELR